MPPADPLQDTPPLHPPPASADVTSRLSEADENRLLRLLQRMRELRPLNIGYPCNQAFDYSQLLPFLEFPLNNVGDPFAGSSYRMNTHQFEREVISHFARFTAIGPAEHWGYVTNGGTEGNMYGLYLGRELLPDGIVYYSEHTHYSVAKILRLQHTRSIMIRSLETGEMDLGDLEESLRIHRDAPPILFVNIGTTMTGAIDDLEGIRHILRKLALQHHYIHADAALSGMILPFVENPPAWNFAHGVDSISISGHKLIGSPLPCGVTLARKTHVDRIARAVEYVGTLDTTISGSRSGFTSLLLWHALKSRGHKGFARLVSGCLQTAAYAVERLNAIGIAAWRHPHSITVVMPRLPEPVMRRWIIAPYEDICHIITLPTVDQDTIDRLCKDIERARSKRTSPVRHSIMAQP